MVFVSIFISSAVGYRHPGSRTGPDDRAGGLDIGCGTGTNLLYLAQDRWRVTGIDFSGGAIAKARHKLRAYSPFPLAADATRLASLNLPGRYDLALDLGCFHSLSDEGRKGYALGLDRWLKPGGIYLLYARQPETGDDPPNLSKEKVIRFLESEFRLSRYEQGTGHPSAWYYFIRG
jgi:SAM-dependent methyltransferase